MVLSAKIQWQVAEAALELTFLPLASLRSGLGLGLASCLFLGHDESSAYARQSTGRLDRWTRGLPIGWKDRVWLQ